MISEIQTNLELYPLEHQNMGMGRKNFPISGGVIYKPQHQSFGDVDPIRCWYIDVIC
jgi:hypothetical protein